jgi:hypothetical protein
MKLPAEAAETPDSRSDILMKLNWIHNDDKVKDGGLSSNIKR